MTLSHLSRRICMHVFAVFAACGFGLPLAALAAPDPKALLELADRARGGGLEGMSWQIHATTSGSNQSEQGRTMELLVKANENASLAETLAPRRSKGTRLLQVERNMWLTKPGLRKPIPISPRMRLTGMAANGDIAATNYSRDYTADLVGEDQCGNEKCYVLALKATSNQSTYDRITYWVGAESGLGLRAQFYSLSGKPIKEAVFAYDHVVEIEGKKQPFISKMVISDAATDARTTLEFSKIKTQAVPPSEFDVNNL